MIMNFKAEIEKGNGMTLKELRKKRGMTRTELAEKSGVNVRTIEAYEQGLKDINRASVITVYQLSKVLKCAMEDLMEIDES